MNQTTDKTLNQRETEAILAMGEKLKELEQQLATAHARIRELEGQVFGGSTQ